MKNFATAFNYPYASAPDIIRAHQKDAYFQEILFNHLSSLVRRLKGARILHLYISQVKILSDFLYLGLTTLIGNQTLGEEYCNLVQAEAGTRRLPALGRRAGYILTSTLVPYLLTKILPKLRLRLRDKLQAELQRLNREELKDLTRAKIISYLLENFSVIMSPSTVHVITLTMFYFSGSYYELSKRLWGLRYIFTKRLAPSEARVGYEVLGVLLLLQMSVQTFLHLQSTLRIFSPAISKDINSGSCSSQHGLSLPKQERPETGLSSHPCGTLICKNTHTEILTIPRYDLGTPGLMPWLKGQNRKCTLCLEELKDPSAASCGHIYCWNCICDWIREKPECPLCRGEIRMQQLLPLKA